MALVITRPVGMLGCNMSIIADPHTKEAVLVDPGGDPDDIIQLITSNEVKIVQIIITHAHFDHILACNEIEAHTKAPIYFHNEDRKLWLTLSLQCTFIGIPNAPYIRPPKNIFNDGDNLPVRGGKVLHTPGHTKGSVCFYFQEDKLLISGDTLFAGGIGRTDLPGGSFDEIQNSLKTMIMVLPDDTRVIPGHGDETTIGRERRTNPFIER